MPRPPRSVRVDPELVEELEALAREGLAPVTFAEQVHDGLRLLVERANEDRTRRSAALVAADRERAERTYRKLRRQR